MAETGDGTQGLAKKTYPCEPAHTGRRGRLGVLMAETGDGTQGLAKKTYPCEPAHTGRRGRLGVLTPEVDNPHASVYGFHPFSRASSLPSSPKSTPSGP